MTRLEREKAVVGQMIEIYCRHHGHPGRGADGFCPECAALLEYALARLDSCPRADVKTSCRKCLVHCYAPSRRQQIRQVMRYVGPRMLFIHPGAALRHLIDELR